MMNTGINWADATFNVWEGCTKVSPGCKNCYAAARDERNMLEAVSHWGPGAPRLMRSDAYWKQPIKWNREAGESGKRLTVFCSSLADVFDSEGLADQRERMWDLIRKTPHLDWLLLTKRPENIASMLPADWQDGYFNCWLGVSVEDRKYGVPRIDILRTIPAVVRFLSCEPLLEDLGELNLEGIHWAIVGGETGKGARPFATEWAASFIGQCRLQNVAPWVKQLGKVPSDSGSKLVIIGENGRQSGNAEDWNLWPESASELKVRELPTVDPDVIANGVNMAELGSIRTALGQLADGLNPEQAASELKLRDAFLVAERSLFLTRLERGRILAGFKAIYGPMRKWSEFCKIVNLPRQTAYKLLEAVEEADNSENRTVSVQSSPKPAKVAQAPVFYDFDVAVDKAEGALNRIFKGLSQQQVERALEALADRLAAQRGDALAA